MKYNIITLPDSARVEYKRQIRNNVGYPEHKASAFDARRLDPLAGIEQRGLRLEPVWPNAKRGELGVWLSNYDRWKQASEVGPLIVFEDDAIIGQSFKDDFEHLMVEVPDDWDFVALWVPDNQRQDYLYDVVYERGIPRVNGVRMAEDSVFKIPGASTAAKVYQGYGMVALVYSKKGGARLVELAHEYGITGPVDCWIYEQAHMGNLAGYAPRPECASLVYYDWRAETTVQRTERV